MSTSTAPDDKKPSILIEALIQQYIPSESLQKAFMVVWHKQLVALVGSKSASTYVHGEKVNGTRMMRKVLHKADEIRELTRKTFVEFGILVELPADFIIEGTPALAWQDYLRKTDAPDGWSYKGIPNRKAAQTMISKLNIWGYVEMLEETRYKITAAGRKALKSGICPTKPTTTTTGKTRKGKPTETVSTERVAVTRKVETIKKTIVEMLQDGGKVGRNGSQNSVVFEHEGQRLAVPLAQAAQAAWMEGGAE